MKIHFSMFKRKLSSSLLFLVSALLISFGVSAQTDNVTSLNYAPEIIPQGPDAAALGRYGEHPVSYYTGTPQINIPLFELRGRHLSLPIGLSYHAGGVRVDDLASSVGIGWALNAGGTITRSIRHLSDFGKGTMFTGLFTGPRKMPTAITLTGDVFFENSPAEGLGFLDQDYFAGKLDTEPDQFSYNFGTFSGSFAFDQNNEPAFKKPEFLDITYPTQDSDGWTVVGSDGNTYVFGSDADGCVEWTDFQVSYGYVPYGTSIKQATAWNLKEIISPEGEKITFQYTPYTYTLQNAPSFHYMEDQNSGVSWQGSSSSSTTVSIDALVLTGITLELDHWKREVLFTYVNDRLDMPGTQRLTLVEVYDTDLTTNNQTLVRQFEFTQDNLTNKLWLTQLKESSFKNGTWLENPAHEFQYDHYTSLPIGKNNSGQLVDYWGFFNDQPLGNNNGRIPQKAYIGPAEFTFPAGGRDYYPQADKMAYGSLTRIDYPTGGYSLFEYEPHSWSNMTMGTLNWGGGIRIKSIKTHSKANDPAPIERYFKYEMESEGQTVSSGKLLSYPVHAFITTVPFVLGTWNHDGRTYYSSANLQVGGQTVGYDKVTVEYGTNGNNGKEVFEFENSPGTFSYQVDGFADNGLPDNMAGIPNITYDYRNGAQTAHRVYAREGSLDVLKQETLNEYADANDPYGQGYETAITGFRATAALQGNIGVANSRVALPNYPGGQYNDPCAYVKFKYYTLPVRWPRLLKTTQTIYGDDGNALTSVQEFSYNNDDHEQVSEVLTTDSKGRQVRKVYTYPLDYSTGTIPFPVNQSAISSLNTNNFRFLPIKTSSYVDGELLSEETNRYDSDGHLTGIYRWNRNLSSHELLATLDYASQGTVDQVQRVDDIPVGFIWDEAHLQPIARVINAEAGKAHYTSFESPDKRGWIYNSNGLVGVADSPSGNNAFRLDQGSLSLPFTPAPGQTYRVSFFAKGAGASLHVDGTSGAPFDHTINLTADWEYYSVELTAPSLPEIINASGTAFIDEVRFHPSNGSMTTYLFDEHQQVNHMLDENSRPAHFEYDALGRLEFIRDFENNILERNSYNYGN